MFFLHLKTRAQNQRHSLKPVALTLTKFEENAALRYNIDVWP